MRIKSILTVGLALIAITLIASRTANADDFLWLGLNPAGGWTDQSNWLNTTTFHYPDGYPHDARDNADFATPGRVEIKPDPAATIISRPSSPGLSSSSAMPATETTSVRLSQAICRKLASLSVTFMFVLSLCSNTNSSYTRANSFPISSICSCTEATDWKQSSSAPSIS